MKLNYIREVQLKLAKYDFEQKYAELLKLEEKITILEQDQDLTSNTLVLTLGTPDQYVDGLVKMYKLKPIDEIALNKNLNGNQHANDINNENSFQNNSFTTSTIDLLNSTNTPKQTLSDDQSVRDEDYYLSKYYETTLANKNDSSNEVKTIETKASESKKTSTPMIRVCSVLVSILMFILLSFAILLTVVASVVTIFILGTSAAISLLIGGIFLVATIYFIYKFIRKVISSLYYGEILYIKLVVYAILIIICVIIAKINIAQFTTEVNDFLATNYDSINNVLARLNITLSNDLQNLSFNQILQSFFEITKQILFRN